MDTDHRRPLHPGGGALTLARLFFPNFPSKALDYCPQLLSARSWSLSLRKEGFLVLARPYSGAEQSCLGSLGKGCMCVAAFVHKRWQGAGTPWRKAQFFPPYFCVEHSSLVKMKMLQE